MSESVFHSVIVVYTIRNEYVRSVIITNLSNHHYGLWDFDNGRFIYQGEFFRANLVINKPMSYGT